MTVEPPQPDDLVSLYARAFAESGGRALWSMRPVADPTPAEALAITKALRTHGGMEGRRLAEQIESRCRQAEVEGLGETMQLEWFADSDFRFFPAQRDDLFGFVLHPVDLATNKASAAADRREPRDVVDLVTIHESILPLGAVICAAVGRLPGQSPEEMLSDITRHSRFTAEEFRVLATVRPLDVPGLHRRIRAMIEDAERFIGGIPSDAVGFIFLESGKPVQPDLSALGEYQRRAGARGGIWPSSAEISTAMLERYGEAGGSEDPL